jgi:integrase
VLAKRTTQIREGKWWEIQKQKEIYFGDFAQEFLERHSRMKRSFKRDEGIVKILNNRFGDKLLHRITPLMVEDYRKIRLDEGRAKATVNREVACLKCMFNKATLWDKAKENPVAKVQLFKEDNMIVRYLTEDERGRLLKACKLSTATHLYPIVIVALNTGMRKGEILNLRWQDIDLANKFIHIETSKSGKRRDIPMNDLLTETLKYGIKSPGSEYVFCDEKGEPFTRLVRSFKTALRRAGIRNFRFHDCRHTFSSYWMMSGGDIYKLSQILGHSTVKVTERYAHLSPDYGRDTIELMGRRMSKTNDTWMTLGQKKTAQEISEESKEIEKPII